MILFMCGFMVKCQTEHGSFSATDYTISKSPINIVHSVTVAIHLSLPQILRSLLVIQFKGNIVLSRSLPLRCMMIPPYWVYNITFHNDQIRIFAMIKFHSVPCYLHAMILSDPNVNKCSSLFFNYHTCD